MFGIVKSAVTALQLYLMRRRQFDNMKLRAYFAEQHDIVVGLYSYGCFDRWRMPGPMRVGRYCSVANTARVVPLNHPMAALTTHPALYEKQFGVVDDDAPPARPLIIDDDVWIGHNAMILPGCKHIGRGAVVGAGAIITKDVPAYAIMAGVPARKIGQRFPAELIEALEASRWWEMDLRALRILLRERPEVVTAPTVEALAAWKRAPVQ